MQTLSEILAAKRAAKEAERLSNATQGISPSTPPTTTEKTNAEISSARQEEPQNFGAGGKTASEIIAGNGSIGEQTKPAVLSAGLSLKEKLAARLQNAQREKKEIIITPAENTEDKSSTRSNEKLPAQPSVVIPVHEKFIEPDRHTSIGVQDGTIDVETLRKDLNFLALNIEQVDLVRQVVQKIAITLRKNPALASYMKDADVDLIVRGLRRSYNIAVRKKEDKKEGKMKKKGVELDIDAAFSQMGISLK